MSLGSIKRDEKTLDEVEDGPSNLQNIDSDPDAEFGGTEARKHLERRLVRRLDMRMCILIIIYILNYVGGCT